MQLKQGTLLRGETYRIEKVLGQGGFGITYLAEQVMLGRKVAVKEFYMKELCDRDESTSHVTLGTQGSRETVSRFREKFLKEARNIARLNHPNIVRIIDVFEENGTAYYVMEYAENGSLADKVKREGFLSEPVATRYIRQVADALDYIHQQNMNHLDIKPGNIMLNEKDEAVLIDFGLSKQYDATTGNQTSTTPVGISEGYAPMEQYKESGVGEFSPETDIYALGATYFKLLTGITPPSASDVYENGLPINELTKRNINHVVIDVISKAMATRKRDRMSSIQEFIAGVSQSNPVMASEKAYEDSETVVGALVNTPNPQPVIPDTATLDSQSVNPTLSPSVNTNTSDQKKMPTWKIVLFSVLGGMAGLFVLLCIIGLMSNDCEETESMTAEEMFNMAVDYANDKDYESAIEWYRKAASMGHRGAMNNLGVCFELGDGVDMNADSAYYWYAEAAEGDYALGICNLAECYENGVGVSSDSDEAIRLYTRSAELGNDRAQMRLGSYYHNGTYVKQDYEQAMKWGLLAAEQNNSIAQYNVGLMYYLGNGVKRNYKKAFEWFKKSAEQGDPDAQCYLGVMYYNGEGTSVDKKESKHWFELSAEQGDEDAKKNLDNLTF